MFKRLYIFTGKGGVGKSLSSIAFAYYLKSQNKKILFIDFEEGKQRETAEELGISHLTFDLYTSTEEYMGRKLKSEMVAGWIMKVEFFRALINMIPGFRYIIFMGHIVDLLNKDPDLHIIVDSPSSGHALTMLEATHNYKKIFRKGILFDDILGMIDFLSNPANVKVNICTIPTEMSIQEAAETTSYLQDKVNIKNTEIFFNQVMFEALTEHDKELPSFLEKIFSIEKEVINSYKKEVCLLPFSTEENEKNQAIELSTHMEKLV